MFCLLFFFFFFFFCLFGKLTFFEHSFRNTIRVSNSLDPDQARRFVGPDLGLNCLQRLTADDTSRQRVKAFALHGSSDKRNSNDKASSSGSLYKQTGSYTYLVY